MKQFLSILFLTALSFSTNAQTISGKGGSIPDNNTETVFPMTVSGIAPTSSTFGLAAVELDIDHSWASDLEIYLIAPDGFRYKLSIANGGSGQNYKNTIFSMEASINITDADAPFTGSFIPQDNLNYANKTKNTNGVWKLAIKDTATENTGVLNNWSLRFGNIQPFSTLAAPSCLTNPPAADECGAAPAVCNLGGYCGNTITYTDNNGNSSSPFYWPQLDPAFCGSIENNSFITFTAGATNVTFNLWIETVGSNNAGIQLMVFSGACGAPSLTLYGCFNSIPPTTGGFNGLPTAVTATGLTVGNVYYIMIDGNGGATCNYVMQATGSGVSVFNLAPSSTQTVCTSGDPVTLTASGSATYSWTGPVGFVPPVSPTQAVVIATIPGTYTVSSTGGCASKSVTINVYAAPYNTPTAAQDLYSATTFNLTTNNTFILNGQTASDFDITYHRTQTDALNVTNIIPNPLTYSIQPAAATQETIWVSLTDNRATGGGCIKAVSFVIYKLLPLTASNSGPVCADAASFNLFCTSAGAGYTYQWTGPNGYTSNVQNPTGVPLPTGVAPYVYTVTPIGTPALLPVSTTVVVNPAATITGTTTTCMGSNTQLAGSGTAAAVNPWVSATPAVATVTNAGLVMPVAAGTSVITYTDSNGCTATQIVTINALPTISGTAATCMGSNTQLMGSGTAAAVNPWTSTNTATATVDNTGLVTSVAIGTTNIIYKDSNGCVSLPTVITVNALPTITGTTTTCMGSNTQLIGSATAAAVNPWVSATPAVATVSNTGLVTPVTAGTTVITYTNNNGCKETVTVTINALPTISGTAATCMGSNTQLVGSGTAAAVNPWTSSNTAIATVNNTGLVTPVAAGTTNIRYTDSNGCVSLSTVVTINALPTISGTAATCMGTPTQLMGSGTAAAVNPWTSSNTATATVDNTGLVTPVAAGTTNIIYKDNNGCVSLPTVVTINALPTITGTTTTCMGSNTQLAGSGIPIVAVNPWTSSNTAIATVSNTGLVTPVTAGTTVVTYTNNNGCKETVTVTINALPTISGTATTCMGSNTQLVGSGTAAAVNPWTSTDTAIATVNSTGLVTPVAAGTTNIRYTDSNGCVSLPTVVTVNALPTITGTPPAGTCVGSTAPLNGSGTPAPIALNPWISSTTAVATVSNTGVITGVTAGTSVITYTNNNGCTATTTISINALPTISGATGTFDTYASQLMGSGTPAAVYSWTSSNTTVATVDNTGLVTGLSPGSTNIICTDSNGCASLPRLFTISPLITPTFTQVPPICYGAVLAPLPTTSLNGITGVWTPVMDNLNTTNYTFTPDAGQGAVPEFMNIIVYPQTTITGTLTACVASSTPLNGTPLPAAVNPWSSATPAVATVNNAGVVTGVTAGTSVITYTDINGCTGTTTVTIKALPTATISGTTSVCLGSTPLPTITFTAANGVSPYTFTYNINGGTNQTITTAIGNNIVTVNASSSPVGSYNYNLISVTDANCTNNQPATATITVVTAPVLASNNVTYTLCDDAAYPAYANDGVTDFFLHSQDNFFTGGNLNLTVNYYETLTNSQLNVNAITLAGSSPYNNYLHPYSHTLYVRVTNNTLPGGCVTYAILNLKVNPIPIPALIIPDFVKCDDNAPTGTEIFDLHLWDVKCGMTASTTATYFANDPSIVIGNPQLNYLYTNTSTPQTIWVKLTDNLTGCWGKRSFNLVVNPLPVVPKPAPSYTLCETSTPPDYTETFNLSSQNGNITMVTGMIISYHFSYTDAFNYNAITGVGNTLPNMYANVMPDVQTIFIKVTNNVTGCFDIGTMDLRVNQIPAPVAPLVPYISCSKDQLGLGTFDLFAIAANISSNPANTVSFYYTYNTAQQGGNSLSTPANFAHIPTTTAYTVVTPFQEFIYARTTDNKTGCYKIVTVELVTTPAPLAPTTGLLHDLTACDDHDANNMDGITNFDLTEALSTITTNANALLGIQPLAASNYTIKYHLSLAAATAGNPQIIGANNYITGATTIWISIENNTTKCRNWGSFNLIVNKPLQLVAPPQYNKCDDDRALPPRTAFNLTTQNATILTNMPAMATGYVVTYFPSVADAAAGTNAISAANALAYTNAPVLPSTNAQTLGVMVTTPQGCKSYTTLTINVLPIPNPRTTNLPVPVLFTCDNTAPALDGIEVMDLTAFGVNQNYIDNAGGYLFEYYANYNPVTEVFSGQFMTPTAAAVSTGTVYIKVMNNVLDWQGKRCFVVVPQPVRIDPLPIISKVSPTAALVPVDLTNTVQKCRDAATTLPTGQETFNLTDQNTVLLAGNPLPLSNFTVTYYTTAGYVTPLTTAQATAFVNTVSNPQTVYVKVVNNTTGCINKGSYDLLVNPKPIIAFKLPDFASCDNKDGNNDGKMLYLPNHPTNPLPSLAGWVDDILGTTQTGGGYTLTIYKTKPLAEAGVPSTALQNLSTDLLETGTYWIRVENVTTKCFELDDFKVTVEKIVTPNITSKSPNNSNTICVKWGTNTIIAGSEVILDSGIPAANIANYTYQWFIDVAGVPTSLGATATGNTYTIGGIAPAGVSNDYSVAVTSITALACPSNASNKFKVYRSGPPELLNPSYTVTNAFAENQTITVSADGFADLIGVGSGYQYNIDDGAWQTSETFEFVPIGNHKITIMDIANPLKNNTSCGSREILNVQIIDFPHFFTPNGDGVNDVWNVSGLSNQPDAKIYIFDRYGKLLKQISSCNGCGWDGTIIGKQLPADDYWFTIEFGEQSGNRIFKSHFTLKR